MTMGEEQFNGHEKFSELCALAMSGTLTVNESSELKEHLQTCSECREAYREYMVLTKEGIPHLAARYSSAEENCESSLRGDSRGSVYRVCRQRWSFSIWTADRSGRKRRNCLCYSRGR